MVEPWPQEFLTEAERLIKPLSGKPGSREFYAVRAKLVSLVEQHQRVGAIGRHVAVASVMSVAGYWTFIIVDGINRPSATFRTEPRK